MISSKDLYAIVTQMAIQDEAISWQRLYNFSMGNSILVLAWATVYASTQNSILTRIVLSMICLLGGLSGIAWAELGARTREHFEKHFEQGIKIELSEAWATEITSDMKPFIASEAIRKTAKRYSTNPFLLWATPLAFTVLYAVMLAATWGGK